MNLTGKVSWFGGPNDSTDSGHTASGGTTKEPGIAVYNRATLGGYWRVTAPNGRVVVLKQTDLGPAPWTGRKVDVTYSALGKLGYSEHNFPTDQNVKAEYLGKNPPKTPSAPQNRPVTASAAPAEGFPGQAARMANIAGLFPGSKPGDLLLREALEKAGQQQAEPKTLAVKTPAGTFAVKQGQPEPGLSNNLHGILPEGARVVAMARKDQGRDVQLTPGQQLLAPGKFVFLGTKSDPSGFGPDYPIIKVLTGRFAGHELYYGHTDVAHGLQPGKVYGAGTHVATTSRSGHNAPPGWLELGYAPHGTPGPWGQPVPF